MSTSQTIQAGNSGGALHEFPLVPTGTTLDLNGLHLYARAAQITGTVVGGTITQIPNGGALSLNSPTPGDISTAGELDDWTFFGRAVHYGGREYRKQPSLLPFPLPRLCPGAAPRRQQRRPRDGEQRQLRLCGDPHRRSSPGGRHLPSRGPRSFRTGYTAGTGNYIVSAWDVTPTVASVALNQQKTGTIQTPYSIDQWNFSAVAGQQITFDLVNASGSGIAFDLTGPNGYTAFTGITGSSSLITLPASGTYTLTAHGTGGQYGGTYSFNLQQTAQTTLSPNVTYDGTFAGSGQAQLFLVDLPQARPWT